MHGRSVGSICAILIVGCSPATRVTRLSSTQYDARPDDYPIRFYANANPECPYEEIGLVSSRQRNKFISMDAVAEALRKKARELGGDAVIGVSEQDQAQGVVVSGDVAVLDRDPVLSGTVIRFTQSDCTR